MAILDQFSDDKLSSFWNWWLLAGEGFAGAAVAWGIICEFSPSIKVQKIAHRHVVVGVAFEVAFSVLLFTSEERISKDQRAEIQGQLDKIIALETRLASRTISDDDAELIKAFVSPFPVTFEVIPYWDDDELLELGQRLADILQHSGWKLENPKQYTFLAGVVTGVQIHFDEGVPEATVKSAEELAKALLMVGIAAKVKPNKVTSPTTQKLAIDVGIKP